MPIQSLKGLHGNYVRHFWETMPRPGRSGQPKARPPGASQRPPRTPRPKRPKNAHFHRSGLHFEHASQKSHVISLGQFLISPTNVAIPTMPIQSLKGLHGNYVRHFWGTMPRPGRSGQPKARPPGASQRPPRTPGPARRTTPLRPHSQTIHSNPPNCRPIASK